MGTPVQCSDDVPSGQPTFQTGREVSVSDTQDLQTDAERFQQFGRSSQGACAPAPAGNSGDSITITGAGGKIEATNVASSLKAGVTLQLGLQNYMTVNPGGGDNGSSSSSGKAPRHIRNRRNITDNMSEVDHSHMDLVSKGLAEDWRRLGRELHLEEATLDRIEMDHYMQGQYEINYQVIRKWKETTPGTVRQLALALATMGRGDLCDQLS